MKFRHTVILVLLTTQFVFSQSHWESIVQESDTWQYLPALSEPDSNWMMPEFVDSAWQTGIGGFGYGDDDDATVTDVVNSIYLRKYITIEDTALLEGLMLDIAYDDAFVCYVNGKEVARSSNFAFGGIPAYDAQLNYDHEAEFPPERFVLHDSLLSLGENLLAVHIINIGLNSSDMSGRVFLNAKIKGTDIIYSETPWWFSAPVNFESSNLPLILIDTEGQNIPDEPKIMALMKVINNPGGINHVDDTVYEYDGHIGIELRGNTSLMFEKKSFTVETRTDSGTNKNVPFLGLPIENDWVLYAPYSDKSLMRNVLAYHLGNILGRWAPHTRYCELYLNGEYRGVYVLIEKIKIDKNRVDIATLKPEENSGDELTGGYIMRIDRDRPEHWNSDFMGWTGTSDVPISYYDPKPDELTGQQQDYIKEFITAFEYALAGDGFKDPYLGYRPFIDVTSFIDYAIMTELSRDLDGYRCSIYLNKDKNSNGGKMKASPPWDFNICFGNANFMDADNTEGWAADGIGSADGFEPVFWWNRLLQDPYYKEMFQTRWQELRNDRFNTDHIYAVIDSCANLLNEAQQRNFTKFDILDRYVWPNPYIGGTYDNEIQYLKNWFAQRFAWLDANIPVVQSRDYEIINRFPDNNDDDENDQNDGDDDGVSVEQIFTANNIYVYPNPFSQKVTFGFNLTKKGNVEIILRNVIGKSVFHKKNTYNPGNHNLTIEQGVFASSGIYFYSIVIDSVIVQTGKLIKK